jgi:hypothetical protein
LNMVIETVASGAPRRLSGTFRRAW